MDDYNKNLLFVMSDLDVGGVERSAVALLKALVSAGWNVTLRLFSDEAFLKNEVPSKVNVQIDSQTMCTEKIRRHITSKLQRKNYKNIFIALKKLYHLFGNLLIKHKNIKEPYEVVIAYQDGLPTWHVSSISAHKKIAFVHTDFKSAKYNGRVEKNIYSSFDWVVFPSERARDSFLSTVSYPLSSTFVFENLIDTEKIAELSNKGGFSDSYEGLRILTVGRLTHEKGVDKVVPLLKRLRDDGIEVKWYLIGDGPMKDQIIREAIKEKLTDSIILMGKKENPYPFMAQCDIYVQPSNYESYCIAIAEARSLKCPILACDFIGAREQINDEIDGFIVGFSVEEIYPKLKILAQNMELRESFHTALLEQNRRDDKQLVALDYLLTYVIGR